MHIWDDYPYRIYREKIDKGMEKEMTKEEFIEKIAKDDNFAEKHGNLPHVYGDMWRHWPTRTERTIDQLQWLVDNVRKDKSTHSAIGERLESGISLRNGLARRRLPFSNLPQYVSSKH